ncbi:MAG: histidine kinase [Prevotella sp.]|nr:histidine kinase [Prevotella sp.]
MAVFYPNFLWITPRYYSDGRRLRFVLLNLLVIVVVAIAFHFWMDFCNAVYPSQRHHDDDIHMLFILRNMFNLGIVVAISSAMQLASRWRQTEEARKDAEAARIDAELSNLRSQINPHFLLNTLNKIYALTAFDQAKAQEVIQELSKLLRHVLYKCQQPTVPLQDEVEFIDNYIKLMKIRLPQSVDVDYRLSIANYHLEVAPMIFISLVENAFKHGVSPTEPSFIHVSIDADEHAVTCSIQNSYHPKTAADNSGHGIGLQQVQRRLDLSYPGLYTWERGVSADGKTYTSCIRVIVNNKK